MAEREQWAETGLGAVVLLAAIGFLGYALAHAGGIGGGGGYKLNARFGEVGALAPGATVSVAGVKVGAVSSVALDPKTYLADAVMIIDPKVKLPSDSTVKITQDSLLGGQHLAIEPGGALDDLKPGGTFQNTQGAVDLFGLIGQVLRPQGGAAGQTPSAGGAAGAGASPAAAPASPGG
ncbi:outer membrane lipid asymmetry maintenance protein MlaD [Caulobacter sp. S45]|uniref:outer membrane lipid asymmetry maintenance protein MlaD n=1 Tax=Caulobacter sp. S45 TaxID=1641861 RepID=UPI00131CB8C4|nr:outer membrane lipid asymmetry maintenance protein MlaD [Caulobacter sp. S45]